MQPLSEFRRYENYAGPQYDRVVTRSLYVTMHDGVRLAIELMLPGKLPSGTTLPTLLIQTRYWRAEEYRFGLGWLERYFTPKLLYFFVRHGYALVHADVRGTGASFGSRRHEWDSEEVKDGSDLVSWIVAQPWSNGNVGGYGTSYSGNAAELLASVQHPAVKAVLPRFSEFDSYLNIAFPGGIYLATFVEEWAAACRGLDSNAMPQGAGPMGYVIKGVKPVDTDRDRRLLDQAVREHQANNSIADLARGMTFRNDVDEATGIGLSDFSVYAYSDEIEASGTAIYGWGGWFDAGTADAVIRRFSSLGNAQPAMIGPWNHGGAQHASPYAPGKANVAEHWIEYLRFFDYHMKGIDTGVQETPQLTYFTVGEEKWKTTPVWPPAGTRSQRWYLAPDHTLSLDPPATESGADEYTVDFDATTGTANRWYTQNGGAPVDYSNRAEADRRLLVYTSPPLVEDTEITGHPVATLFMASTTTDCAIFVYLEEVDQDGQVRYLTEGQLRALHRRVSDKAPPYAQFGPYHSFQRQDALPLTPGLITELSIELLPISVLIRKGRRIRIAFAGADKDTFSRIPAEGTPSLTIARSSNYPSFFELPVAAR
jgi:hypothetical protein